MMPAYRSTMEKQPAIPFLAIFGRAIKRARGTRTQSDIARLMGRKPQSVSEWEAGKNLPETPMVVMLLEALGVSGVAFAQALAEVAQEMEQEQATGRKAPADLSDERGRALGLASQPRANRAPASERARRRPGKPTRP